MLNYLTQQSLGATAPNMMAVEGYTLLAGAGEALSGPTTGGFPPPYQLPTWLSLVISNTEAAGSGNDIILSYDTSPTHNFGIVIFPQTSYTLDMRLFAFVGSDRMAINGELWPLGGDSFPYLQNNNAGPVRAMGGWLGVL